MALQFASQHTENFPALLDRIGGSLLISTYQAGQEVLLRSDGNTVNTHFLSMEKPMGLAYCKGRLALGCGPRVWNYRAMSSVAEKIEPRGKHDSAYLPRSMHITGDIDIHEMAFDENDDLWVVNTRMSCLCALDGENSVAPRWHPPFITGYDLTDRCHLNGLGMRDGKPRYATALGESDTAAGWRETKADGGILMDVAENSIITRGLSMPHSPRWHQGRLLVLESGAGNLSEIDPKSGEKRVIAELPGFTRGMDFAAQVAFIGLSEVRETAVFAGLPLTRREADRKCGVFAVDINTGTVIAYLAFTGDVREIFAVQLLPHRFPVILEPEHPLVRSSYALPNEALRKVVAPPPRQILLDEARREAVNGNLDGAATRLRKLLGEDANHHEAQQMLGIVLTDSEQWEEGLIALRHALEINPDNAETYNSIGYAYSGLGRHEEALEAFEKAISLDGKFALAHMNRGMVLLRMGQWAEGWKSFEWRWQTPSFHPFKCPQPQWKGEDISDKRLLVHTEQGAGDAIMCARFLGPARARCKKLILVAPDNLRDLLGTAEGVDEVRVAGQIPSDAFDVYCPIMSLPGVLGTAPANLPLESPYLSVPDHISATTLRGDGLKIGFVWRGSPTMKTNAHRSCSLEAFEPLFNTPGTTWFSLQMPVSGKEAEWLEQRYVVNLEPELPGFARTAALVRQLDLVIGVCTSAIHLAGALDVPAWVILGHQPDWRWLMDGESTPWYPKTRLFRALPGESWSERVARVRSALHDEFRRVPTESRA